MASMTPQRWQAASLHLDRLLDADPAARQTYLDDLRAGDPLIAADVVRMLGAHDAVQTQRFLEEGPEAMPGTGSLVGAVIGAYALVSPIGQGGMGSVWLAERRDGRFEGRAAVKLLNAALVGRAGEERFKREGTMLARLDHPHIARLIDAGVSSIGQPYLVLEHIEGQQIDQYCDAHQLSVRARLELFLDVLSAVAHAHANLIVHRDLKPSNVLVTTTGQVKLLDFGIAKWLEDEAGAGDATVLTRDLGGLTPKFAAPEQLQAGIITTATDVYALGVLLYTLLAGCHPSGSQTLSAAELVKSIVERDPPPPSSVVGDVRRQRLLQGDLDTIVAKALKKAPKDRYGSIAPFADDVRRHLDFQPISARADTFVYRAMKFSRRHWRPLAAACVVVVGVAGLTTFYTVQLRRARDVAERQATKASRISELLTGLLTASDPYRTPDAKEPTVRGLLDAGAVKIEQDLADQPELQSEMMTVIGRVYQRMGLYDQAQPMAERALVLGREAFRGDHVQLAQALNDLGVLYRERGDAAGSRPLLEECLAMRRRVLGPRHQDVAITLVELARTYKDLGLLDDSEPLIREALDIRREVFGEQHRETATSTNELALFLWDRGALDEAERLFTTNVQTNLGLLGPDHVSVAVSYANLGLVVNAKGRHAEAEALFRKALAIHLANGAVGRTHPSTAVMMNNLSYAVLDQGRVDEAIALLEDAVAIGRVVLDASHPRMALYQLNLGRAYLLRGEATRAEPLLRRALDVRVSILPAGDWRVAQVRSVLGGALLAQRRYADAEPFLTAARDGLKAIPGPQGKEAAANEERLRELARAPRR